MSLQRPKTLKIPVTSLNKNQEPVQRTEPFGFYTFGGANVDLVRNCTETVQCCFCSGIVDSFLFQILQYNIIIQRHGLQRQQIHNR
jgi:hypothetical protein